jgi:plasmid maintenance system killer protein
LTVSAGAVDGEGAWRWDGSMRINEQYRVCFTWEVGQAHDVEITDDH